MNKRLLRNMAIILSVLSVSLCSSGWIFSKNEKSSYTTGNSNECEMLIEEDNRTEASALISSNNTVAQQPDTKSLIPSQVSAAQENPDTYLIADFPVVLQMPELPTGCEITAMTMVLNYYGYMVSKEEMAVEYLPTVPANLYYGSDGRLYGPDLNRYFVGNPTTNGGYICGTEAILTATNTYLDIQGSSLEALDRTGASPEELYQLVGDDTPVVVWVTISMAQRRETQGWYTEDGVYVDWSTNDHGAVLIGYSENTVTIADPISGLLEYDRETFEEVFASRGNQCVVIQK